MTEQQTNGSISTSDGAQNSAAAGGLQAAELAKLAAAAQRGERQAIDRLCATFAPLVKKEAHADAVYQALGEDAENAAWLLFLELIQKPGREMGVLYPGFLKKGLHLGLLKQVIRQNNLAEHEVGGEKADAFFKAEGTSCGEIELRLSLPGALARLTEKQRAALWATAVEGIGMRKYARMQKRDLKSVQQSLKAGVKKLRRELH